ncbi:tungsten ABC transporter ATP-binding protein [Clostridium carboxidivorans P7]|uniref:ABC transporter related protein n=1 Tax=Clostridium carboxidivorans P7 TaxID=536227 RepID=C6PXE8_9CLOT|nr:energy-coupling factor ABC transporter ATP-binding protein [Clostridium carboxidivorans]AKN31680.1 tungsten ABC transporter ATP-binding protein [Clostridium carboxidivorans P7]EET86074.1 ABC transporter related protein [Clostridium carboxidivorans P7]EFG87497.1 ABC transporter, ATP-binding protein [Clostridium carboxidivorans P7]
MNIEVLNIIKQYGNRVVLNIDKFNFKNTGLYIILGLNGSGKSTFLECIAGVNRINSGSIKYDHKDFKDEKDKISMLLQKPYIFNTSVKENIIKGLLFKGERWEELLQKYNSYIKDFDMEKLMDKNAKTLSGGEKSKTALLRVAMLETKITLLDEPTASMDLESTLVAEKLIKSMSLNGRIVIMITHDLYQAKRIADYVLYMDKGKIIEYGDKVEFFTNPSNEKLKMWLNVDCIK